MNTVEQKVRAVELAELTATQLRCELDAANQRIENHTSMIKGYQEELSVLRAQVEAPSTPPLLSPNTADYKQALGSKNCMQCAAAYMMGLPVAAVPDFEKEGPEAWESFESFFAGHGFTVEMFPPTLEIDGDYLASGDTVRGTSHMVVMRSGKLLHDPHPDNSGLKSIQVVWLIARRAGATAPAPTRPAAPEGWRLVPVEPTEAMFFDPSDACVNLGQSPWDSFKRIYESLLAAAPQAETQQGV